VIFSLRATMLINLNLNPKSRAQVRRSTALDKIQPVLTTATNANKDSQQDAVIHCRSTQPTIHAFWYFLHINVYHLLILFVVTSAWN